MELFFHNRKKELCGDTEVVDVYLDIVTNLVEEYDFSRVFTTRQSKQISHI